MRQTLARTTGATVFATAVGGMRPADWTTMLFRLSRVSFWLAAAVAAVALLAPAGHETLLAAISMAAGAAAFALWRSVVSAQRRSHAFVSAVPESLALTEASLIDTAAMLMRDAHSAPSFEAALHAAARVLRSELGARQAAVFEVRGIDAAHAQVADLIESQPGFHAVPRRVRLDTLPLGRAIATQLEAGAPPGAVALPVTGASGVKAVIELSGIEPRIEPKALGGLLELARLTLSRLAQTPAIGPAGARAKRAEEAPRLCGDVLVVEDNVVISELTTRMLRRLGCRVTPASGMLDALKALGRTQFDLALVDMQVAGMGAADGVMSLRRHRGGVYSLATTGAAPMISIVGPGLPGDTQRLRELGFDDHVCKPFRQSQMFTLLSKYLRPRAPAESTESTGPGAAPALAPAPAAASVLDPAALARLNELDPKGENHLLERVLKAFQTSAVRLRPQADAARSSGDHAGLRLVAHTLKSSSASIGAMHLSQVCAQMEASIRNAQSDDMQAQLDELDRSLDSVLLAIEQLLKECA